MCSVCGTKFGPQKQQHQQPRQQKPRPQQKQAVGLKRTLSAEDEKSNVLFHMGFDDRIVRRALEKVNGGGDKHNRTTISFSNNTKFVKSGITMMQARGNHALAVDIMLSGDPAAEEEHQQQLQSPQLPPTIPTLPPRQEETVPQLQNPSSPVVPMGGAGLTLSLDLISGQRVRRHFIFTLLDDYCCC
jgi:hypothetical protein